LSGLALALERALDALFAVNGNIGGQMAHRGPVLAAAMDQGQTLDGHLRLARQAAHGLADQLTRLDVLPDRWDEQAEPGEAEDGDW
jgi:hypothetical protein